MKALLEKTGEVLPMKGNLIDQGSNSALKGIIINLCKQGGSQLLEET